MIAASNVGRPAADRPSPTMTTVGGSANRVRTWRASSVKSYERNLVGRNRTRESQVRRMCSSSAER